MSKSNWFPNEKLCLRKIKKNRENSGFDKGKDILQISCKTYILTIPIFLMNIM